MIRLPRSPKEKVKIGFWLLNPASKIESLLLTLFFLLLPTQFGKHFWPDFTLVSGIRVDYLSPTIYVTDVLLVLLFGVVIFRWINKLKKSKEKSLHIVKSSGGKQNSKLPVKNKKLVVFGVLVLFFLFNVLFSQRPLLSIYGYVKLCEYVFLGFYLAKTILSMMQMQRIAFLFAISAIFESMLAISQYVNQASLNGIYYFFGERTFTGTTPGIANASINGMLILRPYATFPHPNVLAGYLLVAMVLVWSFLLSAKSYPIKIFACVSLVVSSIALLLTYSRVGILLWVLLLSILLIRKSFRKVKTQKVKTISGTAILLVIFVCSLLPVTHEIFNRFTQTSLSEESVVERTELLSAAWKIIQNHPITGVGLYNFIPSLAPLQKPLPLNLYLQPVHNIFVLVSAEMGIVGLGLFIWLLVATFRRIMHYELPARIAMQSIVGGRIKGTCFVLLLIILVTGMFDHYWLTLQQGQLMFAVIIGLSWAVIK